MNIAPLVVGCGALIVTGRALALGAASADGAGITREDEPVFYWLCVAGGIAVAAGSFYISIRGSGS